MRKAAVHITSKWKKWRETRRGFALLLLGFAIVAVVSGRFAWEQVKLLSENFQWGPNYVRVASYLVRIAVFGIVSLLCAVGPITFVVMSLLQAWRRFRNSSNGED